MSHSAHGKQNIEMRKFQKTNKNKNKKIPDYISDRHCRRAFEIFVAQLEPLTQATTIITRHSTAIPIANSGTQPTAVTNQK